ncbi:MAG TPA: hypothetical protein VGD69_13180 [Herpetosiphonaceae bacterium]
MSDYAFFTRANPDAHLRTANIKAQHQFIISYLALAFCSSLIQSNDDEKGLIFPGMIARP